MSCCGDCSDIKKIHDGTYVCDIRYITKDGKRVGNMKVTPKKKSCRVFLPSNIYYTGCTK